ncbi:putative endonuclease exonuclease phosphatase family protein [Phaeoacremonium minimum UCRPA7]|uniref:Putative endonuclease exonuclease phosphatase family protein n=1 Tax=Phaeoacremonium minimum (strain UCR-PA7) TaxID=1286976 RepID=R8BLU8_PHAM7|nr:putative endonuclease exonuclease phosphatase family protein [Phaeoacremonium minimum UCRPA7]EOO00312.1 putative endonuclease exonuclease phosphatase family protein [Phaeoacremonium minimum UCRPA7]
MGWNPLKYFSNTSAVLVDPSPPCGSSTLQLRVITHNIRYATSDPFTNEKPWPERRSLVLNQLQHELRPDGLILPVAGLAGTPSSQGLGSFICLQEVLHGQLVDILNTLNGNPSHSADKPPVGPIWAHIGVGRDDGRTKGEYSPILYPVKLFKLLHYEPVWLSPTPDRPSKGWDAGSIRILTVGVFEHIQTKQRLVASNTHLDNAGSKSREESIKIILSTLKRVHEDWSRDTARIGIFLAGDFNSFTTQEAYIAIKASGYMVDIHDEVEEENRYGDIITFTGFEPDKDKDEQGRIDFLFLGPCDGSSQHSELGTFPWEVEGYAVLPNLFEANVYLSDHRAVVGDFKLQT